MSQPPALGPAWRSLKRELDRWHTAGRRASFWWRDDDAIAASAQLERLAQLSQTCGPAHIPLALAVIPAQLETSLPRYIETQRNLHVLQHGYAHRNHATAGSKKCELGGQREPEEIARELLLGSRRLTNAFAERFIPVVVPPWNRLDEHARPALVAAGFGGVSTMWARRAASPGAGLRQNNAHLDPINWRGGGGFIGEYRAIGQLLRHLQARRSGHCDPDEATGLLTHHLVQKEDVWIFCRRLLECLQRHPAAQWHSAAEIWR